MADAPVIALFGARGSGKSAAAKKFLAENRPARLMIWDTMDEYGELAPAADTLKEIATASAPRFRYVPRGGDKEIAARFDAFCRIAYAHGDMWLVVEELQRVTRPGAAPAAWSDCTLRGRHRGLSIVGLSQRPASVDKDFFSNAAVIRTGRLVFADDVLCLANVLGVERERIVALKPLQYLERDMASGALSEGALTFGPARARARSRPTAKGR